LVRQTLICDDLQTLNLLPLNIHGIILLIFEILDPEDERSCREVLGKIDYIEPYYIVQLERKPNEKHPLIRIRE
jgi:hypothetical protein